jgi:hypothetical protein
MNPKQIIIEYWTKRGADCNQNFLEEVEDQINTNDISLINAVILRAYGGIRTIKKSNNNYKIKS